MDDAGRVVDVRWPGSAYPVDPLIRDCFLAALADLVFPCLAGRQICQEWLAIE